MNYSGICAAALAAFLLVSTAHSSIAAPKDWIACEGTKVTTATKDGKPDTQTEPAQDVFALDDDTKNFFRYSESRKTTDVEPVTVYTPQEIRWGVPWSPTNSAPGWEGRLDRASMALTLNYRDPQSRIAWTEQCKPTQPRDSAVTALGTAH